MRNQVLDLRAATMKLHSYCEENDWSGYDPYDALNSKLFRKLPFLDSKIPRLVMTQLLKRSPVDLRGLLLVPKTQNAKAFSLFLTTQLKLAKLGLCDDSRVEWFIQRLIAMRSPGSQYWNWGYSFPWQTRTIVVPVATPNLVCTTFVANSLLDVYERRGDARCLEMASSAAEYILNELFFSDGEGAGFAYPLPERRVHVHNANLLGAALLCRVQKHTGNTSYLGPALQVARYSAGKQNSDGSWFYGEEPTARWIDNFHTGYNLGALRSIARDLGTSEFDGHIQRGYAFYRERFFRADGAARYFHDRTYPIDVHCVAQSLITLSEFSDVDPSALALAEKVFGWAMVNMWDQRGYFYYRVLRSCKIRISYMRWSQAWMLIALATLLKARERRSRDIAAAQTEKAELVTGVDG